MSILKGPKDQLVVDIVLKWDGDRGSIEKKELAVTVKRTTLRDELEKIRSDHAARRDESTEVAIDELIRERVIGWSLKGDEEFSAENLEIALNNDLLRTELYLAVLKGINGVAAVEDFRRKNL